MRYRGDYIVLYMLYIATEAELMLNNLLLYLKHEYSDKILEYFTEVVKKESKDDQWDKENNRVVYAMDMILEEEGEDKLGLEEARVFINNQKKRIEEAKLVNTVRPPTNEEQLE